MWVSSCEHPAVCDLVGMAASLWVPGHAEGSDFIEPDLGFHTIALEASGNQIFESLPPRWTLSSGTWR